jgi:hypothetical protein
VLRAVRDRVVDFYEENGFVHSDVAIERPSARAAAT